MVLLISHISLFKETKKLGLSLNIELRRQFYQQFPSAGEKLWNHFVGNKTDRRIWRLVFQENKAHLIFRKTNISYLLLRRRTCAYQGVRNVGFSENLACFVFLKHPFWDSPFCLITNDLSNACLKKVRRKSSHSV